MAKFVNVGNGALNVEQVVMIRRRDDGHVTVDTTACYGDSPGTPGRFVIPAGPAADRLWAQFAGRRQPAAP